MRCSGWQSVELIRELCSVDCLQSNLKICTVLGNSAWSLRAETLQCNSVEVQLMEGGLVDRRSEKIGKCLSEWTREYMTLRRHTQHDLTTRHLKPTRQHVSMWLTTRLSNGESNKCDTSDIPSDDCVDSCTTVLTTLCMSVIDVYIVNKIPTQIFNITRTRSQEWHSDQRAKDVNW